MKNKLVRRARFGVITAAALQAAVLAAQAGSNTALVYPNPAAAPADPVIRFCSGIVDSIRVSVFDSAGTLVHSSSQFNGPSVPVTGEGAGQFCYEHAWTGSKASGTYFAVVRAKSGGISSEARIRFSVVR